MVGGLHIAAEVTAIDFNDYALAADPQALQLGSHGFPQLVGQDEGRLVLHAQLTGQRQRRLAFDLVHENRDGRQIGAERQFMESEQCAAGEAKILTARLAAEPKRAVWTAALINSRASAVRADCLAIGPADVAEGRLGCLIRHAHHLR